MATSLCLKMQGVLARFTLQYQKRRSPCDRIYTAGEDLPDRKWACGYDRYYRIYKRRNSHHSTPRIHAYFAEC